MIVFAILTGVCFLTVFVSIFLLFTSYNHEVLFGCIFGTAMILGLFSILCFGETRPPEKIYQQKLKKVQEAEKELQKFYIDYPQFKEQE